MANTSLFRPATRGHTPPAANTKNAAGGAAYARSAKEALAQYAATGCFNATFYASAEEQLGKVHELCNTVMTEADGGRFIGQLALYARERGAMKDMPAYLVTYLSKHDPRTFELVFHRVINNGKMIRTFTKMLNSGVVGRKSVNGVVRRVMQDWFAARDSEQLFRYSVGQDPSLADVIKQVHPKPHSKHRDALYAYLSGRGDDPRNREKVQRGLIGTAADYENFKLTGEGPIPDVDMRMLTSLPLKPQQWIDIAMACSWTTLRMNLNAFQKHGVFDLSGTTRQLAARLADPTEVHRSKVFPYQLLTTYQHTTGLPPLIRNALQDAMEAAISNVPRIDGQVYILLDVSGSMTAPVTGQQKKGQTSVTSCREAATLFACALLRANPEAKIIPFSDRIFSLELNARDTVFTNLEKLAKCPSGGTNCALPLEYLNQEAAQGALVVYLSDNESWMNSEGLQPRQELWAGRSSYYGAQHRVPGHTGATATMKAWSAFQARNPKAKLACIDMAPDATTQAVSRPDILNVGGFSDAVFDILHDFTTMGNTSKIWLDNVQKMVIDKG